MPIGAAKAGILGAAGNGESFPSLAYYPLDDNNGTTWTDTVSGSTTLSRGYGSATPFNSSSSSFAGVSYVFEINAGAGDFVYHPTPLNFATTDYTIEIFHKQTPTGNTFVSVLGLSTAPASSGAWAHMYTNDGVGLYTNAATYNGSANITSGLTLTDVKHFCMMSSGGTLYFAEDGNVFASVAISSANVYAGFGVRLHSDIQVYSQFSQFRITEGARYDTSGFTAPTSPLSA